MTDTALYQRVQTYDRSVFQLRPQLPAWTFDDVHMEHPLQVAMEYRHWTTGDLQHTSIHCTVSGVEPQGTRVAVEVAHAYPLDQLPDWLRAIIAEYCPNHWKD